MFQNPLEGIDDIENPAKADQKLNLMEKSLIYAAIPLAKILLWKLKRAKTYGDIMKLSEFIEGKLDEVDEKYGDVEVDNNNVHSILQCPYSTASAGLSLQRFIENRNRTRCNKSETHSGHKADNSMYCTNSYVYSTV